MGNLSIMIRAMSIALKQYWQRLINVENGKVSKTTDTTTTGEADKWVKTTSTGKIETGTDGLKLNGIVEFKTNLFNRPQTQSGFLGFTGDSLVDGASIILNSSTRNGQEGKLDFYIGDLETPTSNTKFSFLKGGTQLGELNHQGNMTILGTYSPFTGTHIAHSTEKLEIGELVQISSLGFEQNNEKQPIWLAEYCSIEQAGIFGIVYDIVPVYETVPETVIKEVQKYETKLVTDIVLENDKYISKEISTQVAVTKEVELYDTVGNVIGKHTVPVMEEIEVEEQKQGELIRYEYLIACLGDMFALVDENSDPIEYGDYLCASDQQGKVKKYAGTDLRCVIGRAGQNWQAGDGEKIAITKE